jgi:hypothetical protein
LWKTQEARCKSSGFIGFLFIFKKKNGGPSPRSLDRVRVAGPWVHRGPHSGRSSPELGLAAAPGHGDLPWRHGRQESGMGILMAGSPRVEGRRGGPAVVGSEARWRCSVCEALEERR